MAGEKKNKGPCLMCKDFGTIAASEFPVVSCSFDIVTFTNLHFSFFVYINDLFS